MDVLFAERDNVGILSRPVGMYGDFVDPPRFFVHLLKTAMFEGNMRNGRYFEIHVVIDMDCKAVKPPEVAPCFAQYGVHRHSVPVNDEVI